MVEIRSSEELREWLKDKPRDWAQVIAARAALRVMPHALTSLVSDHWVEKNSLVLFRGTAIAWAARNFSTHNMGQAAHTAGAALDAAHSPEDVFGNITALNAVNYAIRAALGAYAVADAARAARALDLEIRVASTVVWNNISADCDWLDIASDGTTAAINLTHEPLWLRDEPNGWLFRWKTSSQRLLMLNPSNQVWIDWYERRIEGHDAAFAIPGDTDRTEDKAILRRLADATDEDFWDKGAAYVNTTLQSWIDEARINAEINAILVKLRAGVATRIGTPDEFEARRALLDALDRLTGKPPMQHGRIGHNYPPEGLDAVETSAALPSEVREPIEAMATELQKSEPDPIIVAEKALLFHRILRKLEKMASVAGDKFAEGFGDELGKGAGKLVTRLPYALLALPLIAPILAWLRAVIG